jgi:DNA-binding NarL/FixJ family response regulator
MNGLELVLAFLAGVVMGGALDRFVLPLLVDAWIDRLRHREIAVVAAVLYAGSEKAAAHRLGRSHSTVRHHLAKARSKVGATTTAQLVWILEPRLPELEGGVQPDE